jgi:hypothetical protein
MDENQKLIDEVIEEMKLQIADNDWSVIEEGVVADHTFDVDCYPERVEVDNVCEEQD